MSSFTIFDAARILTERYSEVLANSSEDEREKLYHKSAKKLCEELLELGLEVKYGERNRVADEARDVLLRVLVVLAIRGISFSRVTDADLKRLVDAHLEKEPFK